MGSLISASEQSLTPLDVLADASQCGQFSGAEGGQAEGLPCAETRTWAIAFNPHETAWHFHFPDGKTEVPRRSTDLAGDCSAGNSAGGPSLGLNSGLSATIG